jgi:hypothetical protein
MHVCLFWYDIDWRGEGYRCRHLLHVIGSPCSAMTHRVFVPARLIGFSLAAAVAAVAVDDDVALPAVLPVLLGVDDNDDDDDDDEEDNDDGATNGTNGGNVIAIDDWDANDTHLINALITRSLSLSLS